VIGVGLTHHHLHQESGQAGVDWSQAQTVGWSLLLSPLAGFFCAALLIIAAKALLPTPELYRPPGGKPPPLWIRCLLILTCGGVSFAHGSNDGQKGMGLIMLILIGTLPAAYAFDHTLGEDYTRHFAASVAELEQRITHSALPDLDEARAFMADALERRRTSDQTLLALTAVAGDIADRLNTFGSLAQVPAEAIPSLRNDMHLVGRAIAQIETGSALLPSGVKTSIAAIKTEIEAATEFIPQWVKLAVAIALGVGTMIGWKRVVVTVGERIGKVHMTYAQGGSAEIVTMATILVADGSGLPVSTTHVLSSGVAGTMAACGSRLQWTTVRNIAIAWLLTMPVTMVVSGSLYLLFSGVI
jgi:PiT family inorganic phosphate transporter